MVMADSPDPNQFTRLKYLLYFLCISTGLVVFVFVKIITNEVLTPDATICITKSCIKAANMLIENMDLTVDPCDDFYRFSCGGYIKNARLTESKSSRTIFNDLSEKVSISIGDSLLAKIEITDIEAVVNAKKLFKSCTDEESIEKFGETKVVNFIAKLGGWPLLNNQFNQDANLTLNIMHKLFSIDINPLFNMYVSSMPSDPTVSMLRLSQASWFLLKEYYDDPNIVSYYKKMIIQVAKLMNSTNLNLEQDVDDLFNFERSLAMNTLNQEQRRRANFKQLSLKELNQMIPYFNWTDYIGNRVFFNITTISDDEPILVYDWEYLVNSTKIFQNALVNQKKTLDNLMIWSFVRNSMTFLPKKYNTIYNEFKRSYNSEKMTDSRILSCVNYINDAMPFVVGKIYVEKHFDRQSRDAAAELIENIKNEFRRMLFENEWMDYMSRKAAVAKVDTIDYKIGYPDYTFIDFHLNYLYKDYQFSENEYFGNALLVSQQQVLTDIKGLHKPIDLRDWKMSPAEVNAYYSATANEICFPAGILQQPFFDSDNPKYLNYGGIGTVIGHEITHGFDDRGRLYDKRGVYHPDGSTLWSNTTIENYKGKAQCIIDQYSNFALKQINKTINGYQTQGENIADNGGIKEAFRAYKRWSSRLREPEPLLPGLNFTQEQLFFINYGQVWCGKWTSKYLLKSVLSHVHSNGEFRVIGATSNIESFAQVFNCSSNKRNNPKKKCSVW